MNNSSAGPSSKVRAGPSQPAEATFKRKRGVFQKDCEFLLLLMWIKQHFLLKVFQFMLFWVSLSSLIPPSLCIGSHSAAHDVWLWRWSQRMFSVSVSHCFFFLFLFTIGHWICLNMANTRISRNSTHGANDTISSIVLFIAPLAEVFQFCCSRRVVTRVFASPAYVFFGDLSLYDVLITAFTVYVLFWATPLPA